MEKKKKKSEKVGERCETRCYLVRRIPPPHTPFPSSQTTDSTGTMYFSSYSTRNTNRKRTSQAAKG